MFQQYQSAAPPIDNPTAKVTPSSQAATGSTSDAQPIQDRSGDGKAKDPAITTPVQTIVQDQQTYPAMRDQGRRLT
jgi:hypothetical protein